MTRLIQILLILTATALSGIAAPRLEISQTEWDFGTQNSGTILTNSTTLTNIGDEPLEILEIKSSCGCTTASLPAYELTPGQSEQLQLIMNLEHRTGEQLKAIDLHTNDAKRPQHRIIIKGIARIRVALSSRIVFMRAARPGQTDQPQVIELTGYAENARITELSSDTDVFNLTVSEDGRSLTINPPTEPVSNRSRQIVNIKLNDPVITELKLTIYAPPTRN